MIEPVRFKQSVLYRFDEVLSDGFNCLLLGDLYALKAYQDQHDLGENLQIPFTTTEYGDDVLKQGAMVYLDGIEDDGYTVLFNFTGESLASKLCHFEMEHTFCGHRLSIVKEHVSLYTWRSLERFNQESIDQVLFLSRGTVPSKLVCMGGVACMQNNTVRQTVPIDNGDYQVDVIRGSFEEDARLLEFVFRPINKHG